MNLQRHSTQWKMVGCRRQFLQRRLLVPFDPCCGWNGRALAGISYCIVAVYDARRLNVVVRVHVPAQA